MLGSEEIGISIGKTLLEDIGQDAELRQIGIYRSRERKQLGKDGQVVGGDYCCRYGRIRGCGQATWLEMVVPLRRRRNVDGWVEEKHSHEYRMEPELEMSKSQVDVDGSGRCRFVQRHLISRDESRHVHTDKKIGDVDCCPKSSSPFFLSLSSQLQSHLALNFELEVKVGLVEVVDTDVTILTTGSVNGAEGRDSDVVERTEVTSDTADLLFKDLVVETGFEFSLAGTGELRGVSATYVFMTSSVLASMSCEGSDDKVGAVGRPLQVGDHHAILVGVGTLVLLSSLCVPLGNGTVLVARDDVSCAGRETSDCDLGNVVDDNAQRVLVGLLALGVLVDVVDEDCAELALTLLGDTEQLGAVLVELDALDCGSKLPSLQQLSGLNLPQSDGVVGAAGCEQDGARVDVDCPERTLVALVDTEALTVV
ncbi:putative eukaryotic translation initiation factor 3 subunit I, partial [Aureobasidium melanogenum]